MMNGAFKLKNDLVSLKVVATGASPIINMTELEVLVTHSNGAHINVSMDGSVTAKNQHSDPRYVPENINDGITGDDSKMYHSSGDVPGNWIMLTLKKAVYGEIQITLYNRNDPSLRSRMDGHTIELYNQSGVKFDTLVMQGAEITYPFSITV